MAKEKEVEKPLEPQMTMDGIVYASQTKFKTMEPKFVATVEVASGAAIQYGFLEQVGYDFIVRRANGRVDLLDNDSIVAVRVDDLKKDFVQ